jgi:hypothetical protein
MTQTTTDVARTLHGAPIVPPPPAIEAAAVAWLEAREVLHRAHAAYRDLAHATPYHKMTPSEQDAVYRAWSHWEEAQKVERELLLALGRTVQGPRQYYGPVRGWFVGWDKAPGQFSRGGHQCVRIGPDDELNPLK